MVSSNYLKEDNSGVFLSAALSLSKTKDNDDSIIEGIATTLSLSDNMVEHIDYHDPYQVNLQRLGK